MYTDQARVEAYLKRELTDDEASYLEDLILSVSSFINSRTNREWLNVDTTADDYLDIAESRLFDGNGKKELFVDDFVTPESVKILDSQGDTIEEFTLDTDWLLYPLNINPKESIVLRNSFFPKGMGNIEITAVWGAGVVPADIIMACTTLTGNFYANPPSAVGSYKSESIEGYSYQLMTGADVGIDTDKIIANIDKWKKYIL